MGQGFTGAGTIIIEEMKIDYTILTDDIENGITYIGKALPGTEISAANWQIRKIDETADLTISYADGTNTFSKVWDDRLTYSYS